MTDDGSFMEDSLNLEVVHLTVFSKGHVGKQAQARSQSNSLLN